MVSVEIDGETVVYEEATGATHLLNPSASLCWSRIDGRTSLVAMAATLAKDCAASQAEILPDIVALASNLAALGLVTCAEDLPGPDTKVDY